MGGNFKLDEINKNSRGSEPKLSEDKKFFQKKRTKTKGKKKDQNISLIKLYN